MSQSSKESPASFYANVVAIVASGGFAGGSLLIGATGATRWPGLDPLVWQSGFWSEFMGFAAAIVPLFVATMVGILISRKNATDPKARRWWTIALVLWGINATITSVYHLPANLQLHALAYTAVEAESVRNTWLLLHIPRVLLAFGTHIATAWAALIGASVVFARSHF